VAQNDHATIMLDDMCDFATTAQREGNTKESVSVVDNEDSENEDNDVAPFQRR
jgi:hypothetical protein